MKKIKDIFLYANWRNIFFALLGSVILAFGTNYIYANSDIPEGGILGVCLIIENIFQVNASISYILLTILFYMLAWRLMGTQYILHSSVAVIGFSLFYAIFSSPALDGLILSMEEYPLLAALVGAILIEIGTGITIRFGSAPSAEHALTLAISKRGGIDLAWLNFIRDIIVLTAPIIYIEDPWVVVYAIAIMTLTAPINDYIINAPKKASFSKRISRKKKNWMAIISVGLVITALMSALAIYLNECYEAKDEVNNYAENQGIADSFTVEYYYEKGEENEEENEKDVLATVYVPTGDIKAGFMFYPGGKVDCDAYAPLLAECASKGILSVVVKMPFNLAVFGINRGLEVLEILPYEIDNWYIGGHSLGGSMAASCAANNPDVFDGIIFLAAYSTLDISNFRVLSVYGSEDEIMETRNYEKYHHNLPTAISGKLIERRIDGGNHSYFGMYGKQNGDGDETISNVKQIKDTVGYIENFILAE